MEILSLEILTFLTNVCLPNPVFGKFLSSLKARKKTTTVWIPMEDLFCSPPYQTVKINRSNLHISQSHKVLEGMGIKVVLLWFPNTKISISWEQIQSATRVPLWDCSHDILWLSGTCRMIHVSFPNMVCVFTEIRHPMGTGDMAGQIFSLSKTGMLCIEDQTMSFTQSSVFVIRHYKQSRAVLFTIYKQSFKNKKKQTSLTWMMWLVAINPSHCPFPVKIHYLLRLVKYYQDCVKWYFI